MSRSPFHPHSGRGSLCYWNRHSGILNPTETFVGIVAGDSYLNFPKLSEGLPEAHERLGEVSEGESTRSSEEETEMTDRRALFLLQESAVVPPGSWPRGASVLDSSSERLR